MSGSAMAALIGAPANAPYDIDWDVVHQHLGVGLPSDYRRVVEQYGWVLIGGKLTVVALSGDCADTLRREHGLLRSLRAADPGAHPYAVYPEPGGLLLWGQTSGADMLLWDTGAASEPDRWPTMVLRRPGGAGIWQRVDASTTEIIMALVTGRLVLQSGRRVRPYTAEHRALPISPLPPAPGPRARTAPVAGHRTAAEVLPGTAFDVTAVPTPVPMAATAGLPPDHRGLLATLGAGTVSGVLRLLAPHAPEPFDLQTQQAHHRTRLTTHRTVDGRTVPTSLAAAQGRLRLWGVFDPGETCWWLPTTTDPTQWPVVIVDSDGVGWQRLDCRSVDFLAQWLDGTLDLAVLSVPLGRRPWTFAPAGTAVAGVTVAGVTRDPDAQLATIIGPARGDHRYDWAEIAGRLGVRGLPADYRRLVESRGAAIINGIFLADPDCLADLQLEHADDLEDGPDGGLVAHPAPGGLLVCATRESGEALWWDTSASDPDRWTIVWLDDEQPHRCAGSLTELLLSDLTGRLPSPLTMAHPDWDGPYVG